MLIRVNPSSDTPLFEQIAGAVRGAMARGELQPGDKLPPLRELADSLGVNMHTVRAAYGVLRDEGLVEMRRGRSVTVLGGAETQASLVQLASGLVGAARRLGLNDRAIVKLVKGKL